MLTLIAEQSRLNKDNFCWWICRLLAYRLTRRTKNFYVPQIIRSIENWRSVGREITHTSYRPTRHDSKGKWSLVNLIRSRYETLTNANVGNLDFQCEEEINGFVSPLYLSRFSFSHSWEKESSSKFCCPNSFIIFLRLGAVKKQLWRFSSLRRLSCLRFEGRVITCN